MAEQDQDIEEQVEEENKFVLVYGNPFDGGYTIVGPFESYRECRDYLNELNEMEIEEDEWTQDVVIVDLYKRHPLHMKHLKEINDGSHD